MEVITSYFQGRADRDKTYQDKTKKLAALDNNNQVSFEIKGDENLMKNITLRKDGRYQIQFQRNGKRAFVYASNKTTAIEKLKKLKRNISTFQSQRTKYTLEQWFNYWAKNYKMPFIQYKNYLVIEQLFREINKALGQIELSKLTTMQIQEFYNTYPTSRKKEKIITYLNGCIQKAVDENIISRNVCKNVVRDRKLKFDKQPYTIEQQELILQAVSGTDIECYILLYVLTGIRRNEINNNIKEWLNLETHQLKAINEKQRSNIVSYKYIDLSPDYAKLLYSQADKFTLLSDNVYRKFKKVLNKLNIDGDIHMLRHTFATNYYYLGVPEKVISAWLGHKTTAVTKDVYIGVARKNYVERLNKLYNNLLYKF